jgi:hypothetical protein
MTPGHQKYTSTQADAQRKSKSRNIAKVPSQASTVGRGATATVNREKR